MAPSAGLASTAVATAPGGARQALAQVLSRRQASRARRVLDTRRRALSDRRHTERSGRRELQLSRSIARGGTCRGTTAIADEHVHSRQARREQGVRQNLLLC